MQNRIFEIQSEAQFESLALELFRHQAEHCAPYRQYIELLGIQPDEILHPGQ